MHRRSLAILLTGCFLLVALLTGCQPTTQPNTPPTNTPPTTTNQSSIVIALQGEPTTLDPQFADDGNMRAVTESVFEGLLALDGQTLKVQPALATKYEAVNDKTWRFTIREGVKFHNGDTLTADDVVFSINRIRDENYKSQFRGDFEAIEQAKKIDDKTIEVVTKGPDPSLPMRMTRLMIVSKKVVEQSGDKINVQAVGTGPYKLEEWKRGVSVTVAANDAYWGTKATIKKATFRFLQEGSTRLNALKAGEIDLAVNMLPEYVAQIPKVKAVEGLEFPFLRMNQFKGVMQNQQLRLAASYAIDKDTLAKTLYGGYATVAQGQLMKANYLGFNPNLKPYSYNPAKAKELIKQAGYNGEKIELVAQRGRWLKDGELAEAISNMLRDVGLNVTIKYQSWQEFLVTLFDRNKAPDMMISFHGNELFDADRTFSALVHTTGSQSSYLDKAIDAKIDLARTEMIMEKRKQLYNEIGQKIYDDPAFVALVNLKDIYGMSKRLDYEPRQDGRIKLVEMKLAN